MISVKIGWTEPTKEQLDTLRDLINDHIGKAWQITNLRSSINYIYADIENHLPLAFRERDEAYVQGLIAGYLIAISCEVI
jgi:hypothetical protein